MSSPAALIETAETAAIAPDDSVRTLVLRQLRVLGELAEQGLEVGRAIERQAKAVEPGDDTDLNALAMAHARVARAVRLTIMLQSKLVETLRDRESAQAGRKAAAKASAARIIGDVIDNERANDSERSEHLRAEAAERLEDEDFADLLERPFGEVVAGICRDLGLAPDWLSLAQDCAAAEVALNARPGEVPPEPDYTGPMDVEWLSASDSS